MEKLYDFAPALGVAWVEALFPRSYLDVNRNTTEIDVSLFDEPWPDPVETDAKALAKVRLGKGLVWRITDEGVPIYDRRLSVQEVRSRIDAAGAPTTRRWRAAIDAAHARHGYSIHLNCHSMPAVAASHATDFPGLVHADFVIGDRDGTSADPALSRMVCEHLESLGYKRLLQPPVQGRGTGAPLRRPGARIATASRWRSTAGSTWMSRRWSCTQASSRCKRNLRSLVELLLRTDPRRDLLMDQVDAIVVGAGAVGLAVARALAQAGLETIVAEAQTAIGQGVSSRNSEVIHAGLYYPPGSLKARLCVRGKELLYELCASHGVSHRNCGKLVVANSEAEASALARPAGARRGQRRAGGVAGRAAGAGAGAGAAVRGRLAVAQHRHRGQPWLHAGAAGRPGDAPAAWWRWAPPSTRRVLGQGGEPHVVRMADGSEIAARVLVNCASLHACALARRFEGLDAAASVPREYFAKGSYYALAGKAPFTRLIYPAPADAWLGVHLTLDLGGQAKFGPDLEWLDVARPEDIDYTVDPRRAEGFYAEVRRYWPGLPDGALQPSYSGVRPKIYGPGETAPDFRIDGPALHGVAGPGQPVRHRVARAHQCPGDCRACGGAAGGTAGMKAVVLLRHGAGGGHGAVADPAPGDRQRHPQRSVAVRCPGRGGRDRRRAACGRRRGPRSTCRRAWRWCPA